MVLASALLGAVLCLLKGEGGGLPDAIGNLAAPYLIVAVVAGSTARRPWVAAVSGVAATEAMIGGFYTAWAVGFGHEVSPAAVMLWGGAGVPSGLVFGIVGRVARTRRDLRYAIPALLVLEPVLTEAAAPLLARSGFGSGWGFIDVSNLLADGIEIAIGVVVLLLLRRHLRSSRGRRVGVPPA